MVASLSPENLELLKRVESLHESRWIQEFVQNQGILDPHKAKALENEICLRRSQGEPLAYVLGEWPFAGIEFSVGRGVLIPRPETEELAYWVADWTTREILNTIQGPQILKIVDLGAGSGCLGLGICRILEDNFNSNPVRDLELELHLIEKSSEAIVWLKKNAQKFENIFRNTKIHIHEKDWNEVRGIGNMDVVVSNPPYLSTLEWDLLDSSVKDFEPATSLLPNGETEKDPLMCYSEIANWIRETQNPQPRLIAFEGGPSQDSKLLETLKHFFGSMGKVYSNKDMAGKPRFYFVEREIQ